MNEAFFFLHDNSVCSVAIVEPTQAASYGLTEKKARVDGKIERERVKNKDSGG